MKTKKVVALSSQQKLLILKFELCSVSFSVKPIAQNLLLNF